MEARAFADLNNTLAITQFQTVGLHPSNPNLAVGATQDNGTILYSGGFAWNQGRLGDSGNAFYETSNPQTIYASGHYFDLFRSDDGGVTWPLLNQTIAPTDRVQFYAPFLPVPGQPGTLLLRHSASLVERRSRQSLGGSFGRPHRGRVRHDQRTGNCSQFPADNLCRHERRTGAGLRGRRERAGHRLPLFRTVPSPLLRFILRTPRRSS